MFDIRLFFRRILNFVLPPRCLCCGKIFGEENGICPECFNEMTFISAPYCRRCGRPFTNPVDVSEKLICPTCLKKQKSVFRLCRSALRYDEASKRPIVALKFQDRTENAGVLAHWLFSAGRDIWAENPDLIIPVPLHYFRLLQRRYNQSALLGSALSRLTGIPMETSALIRYKATKPQVGFSGRARVKNVRGVFKVRDAEKIRGRHIVLIDDVWTTGSTLRECAKTLLAAGAASVDALTVARVLS